MNKHHAVSLMTIVLFIFLLSPIHVYSSTYIHGKTIYPNCNPPEINCGFSVTPNSVIAYIGDSWTAGNHILSPLYYFMNAHFPFAGVGYVPVDSYPYNLPLKYYAGNVPPYDYFLDTPPPEYEVTRTTTGTWTDSTKTGSGPNLMRTNSTDTATPASKSVTCAGTDYKILFLKQPGGGSFGYSIDGGATTTISTASTTSFTASVSITGQTLAQHTILMSVIASSTSGVSLYGVECAVNNSGGIRIDKLGMSGSRGPNWSAANATIWQTGIAQLNPSLVIITLGQNDVSASETPDTYINSIKTIIANIRVASSTVPIILAPQNQYVTTGPIGDVSAYYPSLQDLAIQNGYGYIEASQFIGSYAVADALGYWAHDNPGHMSSAGDQVFSNALVDYLGLTTPPTIISIDGLSSKSIVAGRTFTLNGTNFASGATVTVGGQTATTTHISSTTLSVISPPNILGTYDIVVTNYIQSATCSNCLTYIDDIVIPPPVITPHTSYSGGTAASRVSNLMAMGNYTLAQEVAKQYKIPIPFTVNQTSATPAFTRALTIGNTGNDVKLLQQYLNTHGYVIATTGPGSPSNETTMFGSLTKKALQKFQKDNKIPATGFFGPLTKQFINSSR